jgi:hypothetical protein
VKASPKQDLIFHGGKIIPNLNFVNFYVAGETAWIASDIKNIDHALAAAMSDKNLNNVMMQYFKNQPITTKFLGSHKLAGAAPAVVSQGDAEALVASLSQDGSLAGVDTGNSVVNLLLPPGTVLTTDAAKSSAAVREARMGNKAAIPHEDEASSKNGLGGYHGSIHIGAGAAATTIYYAIGAYSQTLPDGTENGIPAFPLSWKSVVATFYHELNEARTDADVEDAVRTGKTNVLGWTSKQGEEVGDFPIDETNGNLALVFQEVPLADGTGTVPVQFLYSNAVHGPEGPIPQPHPLT